MTGIYGQRGLASNHSLIEQVAFLVHQILSDTRTSVPVKVIAVHGGGVAAPPTVDVQIMVKQADGVGNSSSHSTIYGIPCARNQGGGNAVINDPKVGDYGHMVVSDRDISSVKNNAGAESNPGSLRRHDLADGVYHAAILNKAAPNQFLQFTDSGITIADKNGNTIVMGASGITLNGVLIDQNGNITSPGTIINNGHHVDSTHVHINTQPGSGTSGVPA